MKKDLKLLRGRVELVESGVAELRGRIFSLEKAVKSVVAWLAELRDRVAHLERGLAELGIKAESPERRVVKFEKKYSFLPTW